MVSEWSMNDQNICLSTSYGNPSFLVAIADYLPVLLSILIAELFVWRFSPIQPVKKDFKLFPRISPVLTPTTRH